MVDRDSGGNSRRELQARLLWFRSDHPDSEIETELAVAEEDMGICHAVLRTSSAGAASSHGMALREEFGALYVEVAEDRALSRALTALGYGFAPAVVEHDEEETSYAQVPPIELASARSHFREELESGEETEPGPPPQPIRQPVQETEQRSDGAEDDSGADVNWNKFWAWARQRGYTSAKELNEILQVDNVLAYTPREVRQMLVKYEMDNPPGGQEE